MKVIDIGEVRAWAHEGGMIARGYFNRVSYERKPDRSWVTRADLEIEQQLRRRIMARYPDHAIIGEEQGGDAAEQEYAWVLDPLDGTAAFVAGLPIWGVSIGLLHHGEPVLGVIYLPLLDDCYWADIDGPAYLNDVRVNVNPATEITSDDWIAVHSYVHRTFRISFPGKTRSLGSIVGDFCYVARGSSLGALIGRARIWDLAAGMAILRAAGGVVCSLSGQPFDPQPLLSGGKLPEPLILSTPDLIERIRGMMAMVK